MGPGECAAARLRDKERNLTSLPKNFTYEAEIQFENLRNARTALILHSNQKEVLIWWIYADARQTQIVVAVENHTEERARLRIHQRGQARGRQPGGTAGHQQGRDPELHRRH